MDHRRTPPPDGQNDRRALLSAYKDVVKSEAERGKESATPARRPVKRSSVLLFLTVLLAAALALHNLWLDPVQLPPESREIREASLRLVMARQIHGIETWRAAHGGAVPDSATAASTTLTPFKYAVEGGNYTLTGTNGDITLHYSSIDSLAAFLGNSYEVVRQRGRP